MLGSAMLTTGVPRGTTGRPAAAVTSKVRTFSSTLPGLNAPVTLPVPGTAVTGVWVGRTTPDEDETDGHDQGDETDLGQEQPPVDAVDEGGQRADDDQPERVPAAATMTSKPPANAEKRPTTAADARGSS